MKLATVNSGILYSRSFAKLHSITTTATPIPIAFTNSSPIAALIAPYPPGIPVLAPGELITAEAVAALREVAADGGRIAYAADPTLATFQVIVS